MEHTPIRNRATPVHKNSSQQKMVGFRLPPGELARCAAYADEQARSVTSFIRMLALRGLDQFEAERKAQGSRRR